MIFLRTEAPQHGSGQSEIPTALADGTWADLWPTLGMKEGEFPTCQQTPHATKAGPHGARFRCGLHGQWARALSQSQLSQSRWQPMPTHLQAPRGWTAGGFSEHGGQTLYTVFSTGRTYDARGPPPYPCVRCNGMHRLLQPCATGAP